METSSRFTSPAYDLLPTDVLANIPNLGETAENPDPMFHLKWFTPDAGMTWYVAEYDPDSGICHGLVIGLFPEWGTFTVEEIRTVRGRLNLPVERDLYFDPCPSSTITRDY